jgi:hypothetical protein
MIQRKRLATKDQPIPHRGNGYSNGTAYRPQDGYAAPSAEDRADAAVLAEATELGDRLAIQCPGCVQVRSVHGCFPNCGAR